MTKMSTRTIMSGVLLGLIGCTHHQTPSTLDTEPTRTHDGTLQDFFYPAPDGAWHPYHNRAPMFWPPHEHQAPLQPFPDFRVKTTRPPVVLTRG